jgi:hypothetical protein
MFVCKQETETLSLQSSVNYPTHDNAIWLTSRSKFFLEKLSHSANQEIPYFYGNQRSSQEPATGPYHEPDESI